MGVLSIITSRIYLVTLLDSFENELAMEHGKERRG